MKKLLLLALVLSYICKSQKHEWLVTVNPATGAFNRIDSFPGIRFILSSPPFHTMDKVNGRFYFAASSTGSPGTFSLCSANTLTGKVRRHGPVQPNMGNLSFDDSTGSIYALSLFTNPLTVYKIDTSNGATTTIATFAGYASPHLQNTTYNQSKHHIITTTTGGPGGGNQLLSISALTGSIVSSTSLAIGPFPYFIKYNNATNKLYCMLSLGNGTISLAELNLLSGTSIPLCTVTSETLVSLWPPDRSTINEQQNTFTFRGTSSLFKLYTFNLASNTLLSSPNFTIGNPMGANDNIIELTYNNSNGLLYGLHWGGIAAPTETITTGIEPEMLVEDGMDVFPSPAYDRVNIRVSDPKKVESLIVSGVDGTPVANLGPLEIFSEIILTQLPPGIYFIQARQEGKTITRKFCVLAGNH